jgi:N-acetylglucosaminyldiphosphoundecaprenol N-acetyl-beta-D-mannosaminyltransferase
MEELIEVVDRVLEGKEEHLFTEPRGCANVLGVSVDAVNMETALQLLHRQLRSGSRGYVCAVGVHGILESLRSQDLAGAYAGSVLNVPDGAPTVWVGRYQGFRQMDHVTGPALMREVFRRKEFTSYSHFFYGGKPGVAGELARAMLGVNPGVPIAGTYTPPFRELSREEEAEFVAEFNASPADIVWVGISTPRQELFMRRMLPLLETKLMFGVGAAFDFHTGRVRDCAPWVKRAGLQWLHRLMQDPKRLWRRNLFNAAFPWLIALQLTGLREFPLSASLNGFSTEGSPGDRRADRTCPDAEQAGGAQS